MRVRRGSWWRSGPPTDPARWVAPRLASALTQRWGATGDELVPAFLGRLNPEVGLCLHSLSPQPAFRDEAARRLRVVVGELRRDDSPLLVLLVDTCDPASSSSGSHGRHHPAARYWTACTPHADGPDDEVERWHLWVDEVPDDESLDALVRLSATGEPTFIVTTETADWLCVVSENGVDVRLADETSRRQWRDRFAGWLPPPELDPYPDGEHED